MSQRLWSPSQILLHSSLSSAKTQVQCVGLTIFSKRCRWDVLSSSLPQINALLTSLSSLSPDPDNPSLTQILQKLAPLCLCTDHHQHQARSVVSQWLKTVAEISELSQLPGETVTSSQRLEEERNDLERQLRGEKERSERLGEEVKGLKEDVRREKEEKGKWVERCGEAEGGKERLLILVNQRGKELVKSGREVERLEALLKELEAKVEIDKIGKDERDEEQVKIVEELKGKLEERCRVSKQLLERLEEMRDACNSSVGEVEALKAQLSTEQQASKRRRQALDEAKKRTAEHLAQTESLNAQLSTLTQDNLALRNITSEVGTAHAALLQALEVTQAQLATEQEVTAQLRTEFNEAQTNQDNLLATLTQTQQDIQASLQASLQANADHTTAHNLEVSELQKRINELETELSLPFSRKLKRRVKRLVKRLGESIRVPSETRLVGPVVVRGRIEEQDL
jgi:chromosome segregation ATPase